MGWRDGSEVKSTDCSHVGPEFGSQQPYGGSQPSVMGSDAHSTGVCLKIATVYSYK
jgi:allophanate hydrolase subunit 2